MHWKRGKLEEGEIGRLDQNAPLEEGEIDPSGAPKSRKKRGVKKNLQVAVMKKSNSSKSSGTVSKMTKKPILETSSSQLRFGGIHGRISLREMKKAARLNALRLVSAKNSSVASQVEQRSYDPNILGQNLSTASSSSIVELTKATRVECRRLDSWLVSSFNQSRESILQFPNQVGLLIPNELLIS